MNRDQQRDEFIESLYREYYADLKRYSYHYFRHDSKFTPYIEDCIQETFAKATANYENLKMHKNIIGWLVKTCGNELCECLRKHTRHRKHFEGQIRIDAESASSDLDDLERWIRQHDAAAEIQKIYQALTPLEQTVFSAYYVNNQSLKETAAEHGMTENAVHCSAKRIRQKAKKIASEDLIIIFLIKTIFDFSRIV